MIQPPIPLHDMMTFFIQTNTLTGDTQKLNFVIDLMFYCN